MGVCVVRVGGSTKSSKTITHLAVYFIVPLFCVLDEIARVFAEEVGVLHLSTIAANRFADKMSFTPSVVEYPFFTW